MRLVVASNNTKKRREIAAILGALGVELIAAAETVFVDVVEDAASFAGNARKKAEAFAAANGQPALADDSGLCVEALGGAPGIHSARYAGPNATDAENNRRLLAELKDSANRKARFVCALHLAFPESDACFSAEGEVEGAILEREEEAAASATIRSSSARSWARALPQPARKRRLRSPIAAGPCAVWPDS